MSSASHENDTSDFSVDPHPLLSVSPSPSPSPSVPPEDVMGVPSVNLHDTDGAGESIPLSSHPSSGPRSHPLSSPLSPSALDQGDYKSIAISPFPSAPADEDVEPVAKDESDEEGGEEKDTNEGGKEEEGEGEGERERATGASFFHRPLIYYHQEPASSSSPARRRGKKGGKDPAFAAVAPCQIILPNGGVCLGLPPAKGAVLGLNGRGGGGAGAEGGEGAAAQALPFDHLLVFSDPSDEALSRAKVFSCLLYFLFPADLALVCLMFFGTTGGDSSTFTAGSPEAQQITFATTVMEIALGLMAMTVRDLRLCSLFIALFYVDSLINLIRVYSVLQFTHFVLQLAINHVMSQYKYALMPVWHQPVG